MSMFKATVKIELYESKRIEHGCFKEYLEPLNLTVVGCRNALRKCYEIIEDRGNNYDGATLYLEDGTFLKDFMLV